MCLCAYVCMYVCTYVRLPAHQERMQTQTKRKNPMISLPAWDSIYWRSLNLVAIGSVSPKYFFFLWMEENRQLGKERTAESIDWVGTEDAKKKQNLRSWLLVMFKQNHCSQLSALWIFGWGAKGPPFLPVSNTGQLFISGIGYRYWIIMKTFTYVCMHVQISYIFWSANRSILTTGSEHRHRLHIHIYVDTSRYLHGTRLLLFIFSLRFKL